jgi:hypothetical protein
MKSFESALAIINKNPEKYLGNKSFIKLELFIGGYLYSQCDEWGYIPNGIHDFQQFLYKKYQTNHWVNWSKIVQFYSLSDEDAFERFYELWDEFKQLKESGGII